jgi:hypothetical protein
VTRLNLNEAMCDALFASTLQPSEAPTADAVLSAISDTVRRFGPAGCTSRVAQEFGDYPELAAERMRWIRGLARDLSSCMFFPTVEPTRTHPAGTQLLAVREAV